MRKLQITQADIDNGVKWDANSCPVALAASREFQTMDVQADTELMVNDEDRWSLPAAAGDFMRAFDNGAPVLPVTFFIELIDEPDDFGWDDDPDDVAS